MSERRCETCAWWVRKDARDNQPDVRAWGRCNLPGARPAIIGGHYAWGYQGCGEWQAKEMPDA